MSSGEFIALNVDQIPWEDGTEMFGFPHTKIKILNQDPEDNDRVDVIAKIPAGYHEPAHTHTGHHVILILEGKQIINNGEYVLGPGDYLYGPRDKPHGPFDYPDGVTLFASFRDGTVHHAEEGDDVELRAAT
jgi:anti-sigma factor ChrR (cupin superfamily)